MGTLPKGNENESNINTKTVALNSTSYTTTVQSYYRHIQLRTNRLC